jgi:hypothetical protein
MMNFFESRSLQHLRMMLCRLNTSPDGIKCLSNRTVPLINPRLGGILVVTCKYANVLKLDPPTGTNSPANFVTKKKISKIAESHTRMQSLRTWASWQMTLPFDGHGRSQISQEMPRVLPRRQ